MKPLNLIIIEDHEDLYDDLAFKYKRFFRENCNYEAQTFHCKGEEAAKKLIQSRGGLDRIHVVSCDIFSIGPKRGLHWIQRIKEQYPEIVVIGNSRHDISYRETVIRWPSFDMFVDKTMLTRNDRETNMIISEQFLNLVDQDTEVFISKNSDLSNLDERVFKNGHLDRGLNSLVAQVVFSKGQRDRKLHPIKVLLSPLTGGFSGSYVFKMDVECTATGLKTVPAVLKISETAKAFEEANNYKKYVRWILPYSWRVDLLGEGRIRKFGAICYSFVHSSGQKFDSVTNSLIGGDAEAARRVIEQIFSPSYQTWYSDRLCTTDEEIQLSEYYTNEYFGREAQASSKDHFVSLSQKYLSADFSERGYVSLSKYGVRVKEPSAELFALGRGTFMQSICHGDLNSNNIIIAGDKMIMIDFQHTGRGHVFRDFLTFESSIRLHFPLDIEVSVDDLFRFEGQISESDVIEDRVGADLDLPEMYKLILKVRRAAVKNFPREPFVNYLYGVTVFSYRLLRIDDFQDNQYTRILCQIFFGMSRLQS